MSKKEHGTSSHFLTGVIIGAALTSLVTTKTGRRIVKEIAEHGTDIVEGKLDLEQVVSKVKSSVDEDQAEKEVTATTQTAKRKRVFKGVKKK